MKLIIDIPESMFVSIQNEEYCGILDDNLYRAIKDGIPYEPQGDLISREALKEKAETVTLWNGDVRRFVDEKTIDNAPTVEDLNIKLVASTFISIAETVNAIMRESEAGGS